MLRILLGLHFFILSSSQLLGQDWTTDSAKYKGRNVQYYDNELIPSNKAIGGNVFLGYGVLSGKRSEYFTNPLLFGLNVDLHRNRRIIQINGYFGFGKTKQEMTFPDQLKWEQDKFALSTILGLNLGYILVDTKDLLVAPLGGAGLNVLTSTFLATSDNAENEPILPYYKLGFFIDLKSVVFLQDHVRINEKDKNYTCLRFSFGLNLPIGTPKFDNYYDGALMQITLGMGGLSRKFRKK